MPSVHHLDLTGDELHVHKIDPTIGTELTPGSLAILDTRYGQPVTSEVPAGTIDGANSIFALTFTPIAGTTRIFLNGLATNDVAGKQKLLPSWHGLSHEEVRT